jgi:hypothetical protein
MPFKSQKQRRYLYAEKPEVAKKFAKDSKPKATKKGARDRGNR